MLILETGDEVVDTIRTFAERHDVRAGHFTAIGALSHVTVAFFDWDQKTYLRIPLDEQVEVLSLSGDIGDKDGAAAVHAHIVVGTRNGVARGGHLLEGVARPTVEVVLVDAPAHLRRRFDPETGLNLIRTDQDVRA